MWHDSRRRNGSRFLAAVFAFALAAGLPASTARAQGPSAAPKPRPTASTIAQFAAAGEPAPKPVEQYYIEFRSRYAMSYGHSFVVFGRGAAPGKKIDPKQIAGLHPASDSQLPWFIGHVVPVTSETGASEGDTEEKYVSARYRVVLNKAEYDKVVGFIRKLQKSSPVWHAEIYNCNAFVADIAKFMGLKTPTTMVFPKEFITQLRELNRGTRGAITGTAAVTAAIPTASQQ